MSSYRGEFIGRTLGMYVVHEVLVEEAHATTYRASHIGLGRSVAMKIANFGVNEAPAVVRRFQREARVASAITHPNVGKVYDFGVVHDGRPYIVLESFNGTLTLSHAIHVRNAIPFDEVIGTMVQVLSGIAASHECGVIHCNLRPETIRLAKRAKGQPSARIVDFGSCLAAKELLEDDDLNLDRTNVVTGLPYYLAPEQARGETDLDGRVDLHACGAVMYEALTGRRAYTGPNYNAIVLSILEGTPEPVRSIKRNVPRDVEQVIARALAKDRSKRYASALEMLQALEKLALLYGVESPPSSQSGSGHFLNRKLATMWDGIEEDGPLFAADDDDPADLPTRELPIIREFPKAAMPGTPKATDSSER